MFGGQRVQPAVHGAGKSDALIQVHPGLDYRLWIETIGLNGEHALWQQTGNLEFSVLHTINKGSSRCTACPPAGHKGPGLSLIYFTLKY